MIRNKQGRFFILDILLPVLFLLVASMSHAAECERPARLRFSMVPQSDVQKELAALQPLFTDLQSALAMPVEVVMPSSYGSVIEGMLAGAVDLAHLGPAAYVSAKKADPRVTAFATMSRQTSPLEDDSAFYYSILVVRSDSPYATIGSLRGKKLALVDPDSTSGGLIPKAIFPRVTHSPLDKYFGQIVYTGAHDQSLLALTRKQTDAIFLSSSTLAESIENGKIKQADLRILWRSEPIPRDPFVLRGQLCADIQNKIKAVFLDHGGNANKVLMNNLKGTRFVPIQDQDYHMVRDLPR
jgi:phosphonate transport system substrate-binding protein